MLTKKLSLLIVLLLYAGASAYAQEIPAGVRYHKASDEINNVSKTNLEAALAAETVPTDLFGEVTVIGPMLWKSLKPSADQVMLGALPVVLMVPGPAPFTAEGKRVISDDHRKAFWKLFRTKYAGLKEGKVRKAKAEEISYYWATIPFDISEPFWVIEAGADRFIANFLVKEGQARLFWIDRVGDLNTLRP